MSKRDIAAIVLCAGRGTRMASDAPKVLHPLAGRPMIAHLMESLDRLSPGRVVVVVGTGMEAVAEAVAPHRTVVQDPPLGTGHAVMAAKKALRGFTGDVLVVFGADPLITPATMRRMIKARRAKGDPAVVVLGFRPIDASNYGRLIVGDDGSLEAIVEARDATPAERRIGLCNSGLMAVDGAVLFRLLGRIGADNAKGEHYLTDIVAVARAEGRRCAVIEGDADELIGVDSRADLARAEAVVQARLRAKAMKRGATLIAPDTVHLSFDTRLGRDVVVGPYVVFGRGVRVERGAEIRSFTHIEGATIGAGTFVGPFARLRPGTRIGRDAKVGNFVEVKNAVIGDGAGAAHLTYIGDARVGAGANVGAGTITCNYDGVAKHWTDIGAGAFIGSNTALVAPVKVGDGAIVGAGSVITQDVAANALALTRAPAREVEGGGARMRKRLRSGKKAASKRRGKT
ncbi:MAG: bifunctional UDP-N-acetylglucosamine diphosphorylase/glucosamine-1-phosphate N-acetyltransferase GlmU [Rhodospirillales bacterium]|jgi:bifunctional UDP-N-acetylglucosamine pyrophosphorylase/glucosamine-1-phosphate N-acetyltransferase|nr:bifunctional UDP-N-acetylglucosamine diphosphorylase/glucosamine-1-phosphate N-acetyltransferase GlmU [Rhodospirillales bacterium]MDP6883588.1 bifunctional UDP-N-acetylglucosamine diphosphorylase/glucosamine-1-phosphate N-acetyltransferase GlmU [Rhodospirillales bacterium]